MYNIYLMCKALQEGKAITTNDKIVAELGMLGLSSYKPDIPALIKELNEIYNKNILEIELKFEIYKEGKDINLYILKIVDVIGLDKKIGLKEYNKIIKDIMEDTEIKAENIRNINFKEMEMERLYKGRFIFKKEINDKMEISNTFICIGSESPKFEGG